MVRRMHLWLSISILSLLIGASVAPAQNRAEALREVPEKVCSDPDDQARIQHMEAIVRENDPVKLLIAQRCAFASDDPVLRSIAFRAYLATTPSTNLEIVLDRSHIEGYRRAIENGSLRRFSNTHPHVEYMARIGYGLLLRILEFDFSTGRGVVSVTRRERFPVQIRADRLVFQTPIDIGPTVNCTIDLRPTRDYRLVGSMRCDRSWPLITLQGTLF